jgi:hypothetical protein
VTDQALDELTRRVLLDVVRQEYGILIEERPEHEFSALFEKKMKKLLRWSKHPAWHKFVHAAACLLLVLLLTGCAVLAVSPAAREAVAAWVREVYDNTFTYHYVGPEGEPSEEMFYCPTWVPEGYELFDTTSDAYRSTITYFNKNDDELFLACLFRTESMIIRFDLDEGDVEKQVFISGRVADLYLDQEGDSSALVWTDEEKNIAFLLRGSLTEEEFVKAAESIQPLLPQQPPHRPAWVPEGYECRGTRGGLKSIELRYEHKDENEFYFRYWDTDWGDQIPTEMAEAVCGLDMESAEVNGFSAELYTGTDGINHLYWTAKAGEDLYWISGPLTGDELVRIAESVGGTE